MIGVTGIIGAVGVPGAVGITSGSGGTPPPPSGNLIVSDSSSLTGEPDSTGYAAASFSGGSGIGSLSPPVSVGGVVLDAIYSNNTDIGDGTKKYIFMGDVGGLIEGRVNATFNGVTYEFDSLFGAGSPPGIQSDSLYDFLLANRDTPIVFTAEAIAPDLVVGFSSEPGDLRGFNDGTVSSPYTSGLEQYGSTTILAMPNGESIGGIGFGRAGFSGRVIISRPNNAIFTDVGSLYANLNDNSYELTTGQTGNFQGAYLSSNNNGIWSYISGLNENQGISFSITETPLFNLAT